MLLSSAASKPWFASCKSIADAPSLAAVREALPWSLCGLLAGLLAFVALVPVHRPLFSSLIERISLAELPAFGVMAFSLAAILPYRLAMRLGLSRPIAVAASLTAFLLALPLPITPAEPLAYLHRVGESGLFLAILAALGVVAACSMFRRQIASPLLADAAAGAAVIVLALMLFDAHISLGNELIQALRPLGSLGDTYAALLLITLAETLLWTFGIHGPAALAAIVTPVYLTLQMQNTDAFSHHRPLPHIVVVSLFLFVFPGGAGATLPLAALLAFSKVERLRKIGRLTVIPAIFNVNEPLVFGLPIVLNPFVAIPFVIVPVVLATVSYIAIAHGLVARPALYVPSGLPSVVSTYLATFDVRAIALVAVNITLATLMYLPFVRAYEAHEARAAR